MDAVTFRAAVREANGDHRLIARALGLTPGSVRERIERDPELAALYAKKNTVWGTRTGEPHQEPSSTAHLHRKIEDLPPSAPSNVELAGVVAEMDREAYRKALKEYGVSDKQLKKLRALDGLAKNSGKLLSVSLQMTHQNYLGQLHRLADVADDILEMMKPRQMTQGGPDIPLAPEDYAGLAKCYIETVKEAGKGYQLIMEGTQAMVRMMALANGSDPDDGKPKGKPGWGAPKQVN